tara:strand:- start:121 stop:558 length:438 start_codon:yes stop_codon:yes gene_type:complete
MFSAKFFLKLGADVRDEYRKDVFEKGKDVHGKSFKPYSQEYSELKKANTFKLQDSAYANKVTPVLTGALMEDLAVTKPTSTGFFLGWNVWGSKVISLNKQGRELTTKDKPLPDSVLNFMSKELCKYIDKKYIKPNCKTTKHKIGK